MVSVTEKMRSERLRYAIARETDRQAVTMEEEARSLLVDTAMSHIDTRIADEEERGTQVELAEKTLNPVITSLAALNGGQVTYRDCLDFLANPSPRVFPWTSRDPVAQ